MLHASPVCVPVLQLPPPQVWPLLHSTHALPPLPHALVLVPATQVLPLQQPDGHACALQPDTQLVPLHDWPLPHALHAAPPVPHDAPDVPGRHTLPLQQPDGHVCALHVGVAQAPLVQLWPLLHSTHALPPLPHVAVELPGRHTLPLQQPDGHVCALHAGVTQTPAVHDWPDAQLLHCAPLPPHADVVLPGMHTLPAQQPVGHVCGLQVAPPLHTPLLQVWPDAHAAHIAPLPPHAVVAVPARHTLPSQQPEGHVVGVQVLPPTHTPALQVWPDAQVPQAAPPLPHADVDVPGMHTLPLQQPSGQVAALQVEGVVHTPSKHA